MSVQVIGTAEIRQALGQIGQHLSEEALRGAVDEIAAQVAAAASDKAPRLTGDLAANIETDVSQDDVDDYVVSVGPAGEQFYGMFQEFGTPHHRAQPFLRPALDEVEPKVASIVAAAVKKELS